MKRTTTAQLRACPGSAGHCERMAKYGFTHVEIDGVAAGGGATSSCLMPRAVSTVGTAGTACVFTRLPLAPAARRTSRRRARCARTRGCRSCARRPARP
ncbi:hypothetical protein BZY94_27630 [Burkholderia territorii]|nr:hypothetical protein BZY94_27630 [Burkholderia territorii]